MKKTAELTSCAAELLISYDWLVEYTPVGGFALKYGSRLACFYSNLTCCYSSSEDSDADGFPPVIKGCTENSDALISTHHLMAMHFLLKSTSSSLGINAYNSFEC